ncbi:MAG: accessory regulator AgrB [Herbinix sp.]|jgi:accessory gene regulator B|nr:accessory regulator AgrB [Herbinix sp.]
MAEKIALQLNYDEDKRAVIAYGLTAMIQMVTIFASITTIGLILHIWYECFIIYMSVGIIRKSTGGAHSKSMQGCIVVSVLSITGLSVISRYALGFEINVYANLLILFLVFTIGFIVFYLRVPVDSPNKPIIKSEKIKRLRKQSFILLAVLFVISFILILLAVKNNRFYSLAFSIRLAMLWQVLTLTKTGIQLLGKVDAGINAIFELG